MRAQRHTQKEKDGVIKCIIYETMARTCTWKRKMRWG